MDGLRKRPMRLKISVERMATPAPWMPMWCLEMKSHEKKTWVQRVTTWMYVKGYTTWWAIMKVLSPSNSMARMLEGSM